MELSQAARQANWLVEKLGPAATRVTEYIFDQMSPVEGAALFLDWSFWARPKQLPPPGDWLTWGFLTGRALGKTLAISNFINEEIYSGHAKQICLVAQDEQSAIDIQVLGPSGLLVTAPPWNRAHWEASALKITWDNGSTAWVRTPEVPGKIRGLEYHLSWASEIQSWPKATREEALENVFLSTRKGRGRIVWDATPKRKHPLILKLQAEHEHFPELHVIVRGRTDENRANLSPNFVEELTRKYAGTARGREELLGEMLEDVEGALWRQAWIDTRRRHAPETFSRRVISIDPAITARAGSDTTGIIDAAVGTDGQGYVLGDYSGKYKPDAWGAKVLDLYVKGDCDLVVAETNKGGDLVAQNLKSLARSRGLEVIVVGKDERPHKVAGKVYVKEVHARGEKGDRAAPIATAYERGRVSHVIGVELSSLEDTLTTWEPPTEGASRRDSPGDLDALVHSMVELLDLTKNNVVDSTADFRGIKEMGEALFKPAKPEIVNRPMSTLALSIPGGGFGTI